MSNIVWCKYKKRILLDWIVDVHNSLDDTFICANHVLSDQLITKSTYDMDLYF